MTGWLLLCLLWAAMGYMLTVLYRVTLTEQELWDEMMGRETETRTVGGVMMDDLRRFLSMLRTGNPSGRTILGVLLGCLLLAVVGMAVLLNA